MLASLSEVANTLGKIEKINAALGLEKFNFQDESYELLNSTMVDLTISNEDKRIILIEAKAEVLLSLYCGRCLEPVEFALNIDLLRKVDFNKTENDKIEELDVASYISGYTLDIDKLIYDEMVVTFPFRILCKEKCEGICKQCGTNLNLNPCDCDKTEYDPRMLAIRDIFNNSKEV